MQIIDLSTGKAVTSLPEVNITAAIGNFDGVHRGHQSLIAHAAAQKNGKSAVWTFESPSSLVLGRTNELLTTHEERYSLFRDLGIDLVFTEDFDLVRDMSALDFAKHLMSCGIRTAVCGEDFRYGKDAVGTAKTLKKDLADLGGAVVILPPVSQDGVPISSTRIRNLLKSGETEAANAMLGRCYALSAPVVEGKRLGRTLGFPTANQQFPPCRVIPKYGVYATRIVIDGKSYFGVSNVGVRPTVEETVTANCETYILDFSGDLYGKTIVVEFCKFLRSEQKYESVEQLCQAVKQDIDRVRACFTNNKPKFVATAEKPANTV